jgi:hypothetical protein
MGRTSDRGHDNGRAGQSLVFALGAAGGLALGYLLSQGVPAPEPVREAGARLRERARGVAEGWTPARLRREARETLALTRLEDAVLDAFLRDPVLSERGIDVGCISRGIIELSGTVYSAEEAERAVRAAHAVSGVETVVNRVDVDESARGRGANGEWEGHMAGEWTGRNVGMGRRRQGDQTDPGADDSQHLREAALEQSDRAQFEDEDLAHSHPLMGARPGPAASGTTRYAEDELDNQDPYGKHAVSVPEQPQAMHGQARVGEGLSPGLELAIEQSDVPAKPHSREWQGAALGDADNG